MFGIGATKPANRVQEAKTVVDATAASGTLGDNERHATPMSAAAVIHLAFVQQGGLFDGLGQDLISFLCRNGSPSCPSPED